MANTAKKRLNPLKIIYNGVITENPIFRLVLGTCPTIAVTTTAINAIGMGLSTTFVLICSNLVISLLLRFIPNKVRIPCFVVVIASFVTIVDLLLKAYVPALSQSLGLFIPLIVVNCIILARAEAFASKNGPLASVFDGLGMGLGFTLSLLCIGLIREIVGAGSAFGIQLFGASFEPMLLFALAPGGFITFGLFLTVMNLILDKRARKKEQKGAKA